MSEMTTEQAIKILDETSLGQGELVHRAGRWLRTEVRRLQRELAASQLLVSNAGREIGRLHEVLESLRGPLGALTFVNPREPSVRLIWYDEAIRILEDSRKS